MKKTLSKTLNKSREYASLLLLCVFLCFSSAAIAQSLDKQITVVSQNEALPNVLKKVEKASGFRIMFTYDEVQQYNVSASVVNQTVNNAMRQILKGLPFKFTVKGKFIYVTKENSQQSSSTNAATRSSGGTFYGKVVDASGEPLPGVTIKFKDADDGTITDGNGEFSINAKNEYANLVFSYLGMKTIEKTIRRNKSTKVVLDEDISTTGLDEVVVIGYGTAKQKDLTGAVSRVGREQIEATGVTNNLQSLLQGEASGVNVNVSDASPTSRVSVVIRGLSSLSGNGQPLWVIDGVPQYVTDTSADAYNTLYNLNLNDVESIDILKDASATAIYGSRAANGVVLVTTRAGSAGSKPKIEFKGTYGFQKISTDFRVLNAQEYIQTSKLMNIEEAFRSGGMTYFTNRYMDQNLFKKINTSQWSREDIANMWLENAYYDGTTDWWNLMTQDAPFQDYSVSASGGSASTSYYVSLNYKNQEGVVKGSKSDLLGLHFNLETMVSNKLKLGVNATLTGRTADNKDSMIPGIIRIRPDYPAYNEDGTVFTTDYYTTNPLLLLDDTSRSKARQMQGSLFLEYNIFPFLKFRSTGNLNYSNYKSDTYTTVKYSGAKNYHTLGSSERSIYVWDNLLTFYKTMDIHDVTAMLGSSIERMRFDNMSATGSGFPDDYILTTLQSATTKSSMSSTEEGYSMASFFARLQYKLMNRYLLTATYRADGSSRFGKGNRWGYFPSAAVGWIISEEDFMKSLNPTISYLKLRASWGKTGSQNLGIYDFISRFSAGTYNGKSGTYPSSIGNDNLQWESQTQTDIGLDFGLFNDRIHGSLGWYRKYVDNLIYYAPLPTSSSFSSVNQNIGAMSNTGVEFDLTAELYRSRDTRWSFKFNIAKNNSKVEKIDGVNDEIIQGYNILKEGEPVGSWYGYVDAGRLFLNEEEVWALKLINASTGAQTYYRNTYEGAGDVYVVDLDGDGTITTADRKIIGSSLPDFFGGFSNIVQWKGLRVSLNFAYSVGGDRLYTDERSKFGGVNVYNATTALLDSWLYKGTAAKFPFTTHYGRGANGIFTNRWLHDSSYLRLNSLNVNYKLPQNWFKTTFIDNIEAGFQATNLFTITKYPGMDPQGNFTITSGYFAMYGLGFDSGIYPPARTYTFSLKLTFK